MAGKARWDFAVSGSLSNSAEQVQEQVDEYYNDQ